MFREDRPDKMPTNTPEKSKPQHLCHQMWSETEGPGSVERLGCYFGNQALATIDSERPEAPGLGCGVLAFSSPQPWMWAATPKKQVTQKYNRGVPQEWHTFTQLVSSRHLSGGVPNNGHRDSNILTTALSFLAKWQEDCVASHRGWESGAHFH